MRSLAKFTRILPVVFILFFACQPEQEPFMENDPDQLEIENFISDAEELYLNPSARLLDEVAVCGGTMEMPLNYQRYFNMGKVEIANSEETLFIQYTASPGVELDKTILVVVLEKRNKINGKKLFDKEKYTKLMYSNVHDVGTMETMYEIPKSELGEGMECVSILAMAKVREQNDKRRKSKFAFARQENAKTDKRFRHFLLEYCMQECNPEPEPEPCTIQCSYGFGIPSVDIAKSFSFEDLDITDWGWGYVHEVKNETLFRLPIKQDDSESAPIIGQVTVMIVDDIAYVYFQMNDGFPMNKTSLYFSHEMPGSGIPCGYTYNRTYTNPDGTWKPTLTDNYEIENVSEILAKSGETNDDPNNEDKKLYVIAYTDFCE